MAIDNKIWLIGGTKDSVAIAKILAANKILFIVSVATATAKNLYPADTQVSVGAMDRETMQSFCQQEKIEKIIDASHPYAVEVSLSAIAVATQLNIPYLRYERNNYNYPGENSISDNSLITELDSFETLLLGNYLEGQKVLLTVGCKILPQFQAWQQRAILYARILPKMASLKTALDAGFTGDRLIAIHPPLSMAVEKALWQQWNISLVITKASGKAGGEDIKRQVAVDLDIPLIIVTRPQVAYPQQTSDLEETLTFCQNHKKKISLLNNDY